VGSKPGPRLPAHPPGQHYAFFVPGNDKDRSALGNTLSRGFFYNFLSVGPLGHAAAVDSIEGFKNIDTDGHGLTATRVLLVLIRVHPCLNPHFSLRTTVEVKKREGFIGSGFSVALKDSFEVRHVAGRPLAQVQEKAPETIAS
jgi:hypothetical protein